MMMIVLLLYNQREREEERGMTKIGRKYLKNFSKKTQQRRADYDLHMAGQCEWMGTYSDENLRWLENRERDEGGEKRHEFVLQLERSQRAEIE